MQGKPMKEKKSIYLNEVSAKLLKKIAKKTGQTYSDVVGSALWLYSDLDSHIEKQMKGAIEVALAGRDAVIERIVQCVITAALNAFEPRMEEIFRKVIKEELDNKFNNKS